MILLIFKILLNWRKGNPAVQTGRLIHFAPQDGVYVYFRVLEDKKVMVVLNKNEKDYTLKLDRFSEVIDGSLSGKEILSGKKIELIDAIIVPTRTPLVLEIY